MWERGRSRIEDNEFVESVQLGPACVLLPPGRSQHRLNVPGAVRAEGEVAGEAVVPHDWPALGALEATLVTDEGKLWVWPESEPLVTLGAVHGRVGGKHGELDSLSAGTASPSNIHCDVIWCDMMWCYIISIFYRTFLSLSHWCPCRG